LPPTVSSVARTFGALRRGSVPSMMRLPVLRRLRTVPVQGGQEDVKGGSTGGGRKRTVDFAVADAVVGVPP
jgi:hypothetical protein